MSDCVPAQISRHTQRILAAFVVAAVGALMASARAADTLVPDWPSYNRTLTSDRYAPFDQINRTNVSRLKPLCVYDLNVETSFQTGPIVIGRTLYATTDKEILAIDAETCRQQWRVREEGPSLGLRVNRGAAYLDRRLFRGTGEGDVLAYDAGTGQKLWSTHLADPAKGESIPAAPLAWNGLVFIGTAGSDRYGVNGRVYALDAQTGKVMWETYTVPTDARQPGNERMQAQARATWGNANGVPITGGGTWTTVTLDAEHGLLYVPVGNPGPDFATDVRPGANLYTNSILVLEARTGITPTKGGLVFAGDMDKHAYALDAGTGKVLWRAELPGAPGGGVITFLVDGKQRVAFVAGTRSQVFPVSPSSAKIVIFGL